MSNVTYKGKWRIRSETTWYTSTNTSRDISHTWYVVFRDEKIIGRYSSYWKAFWQTPFGENYGYQIKDGETLSYEAVVFDKRRNSDWTACVY